MESSLKVFGSGERCRRGERLRYDEGGWSPICFAAMKGDAELIAGLVRQGACPNDETRKSRSALHYCIESIIILYYIYYNIVLFYMLYVYYTILCYIKPWGRGAVGSL